MSPGKARGNRLTKRCSGVSYSRVEGPPDETEWIAEDFAALVVSPLPVNAENEATMAFSKAVEAHDEVIPVSEAIGFGEPMDAMHYPTPDIQDSIATPLAFEEVHEAQMPTDTATPNLTEQVACVTVQYCPTCGLPPDFCEFHDQWEVCRPWVLEHFPHYYPHLVQNKATTADSEGTPFELETPSKPRRSTKKLTKAVVQQVYIYKSQRAKRKTVTVVSGLETFGVNLNKAAKTFAKLFSCGVSVVKSPTGAEQLDIQGNIEDITEIILKHFPEVEGEKIIFGKAK